MAHQPGWYHVATYADHGPGSFRPGLVRLLADALGHLDLRVVDSYGRLVPDRRTLDAILAQLGGAGVSVVVLRPATGRRLARLVANVALYAHVGEALG